MICVFILFLFILNLFSAEGEEEGGINYVVFSSWRSSIVRAFPPPPRLERLGFLPPPRLLRRKAVEATKGFFSSPKKGQYPQTCSYRVYCTQS